MSTARRLDRLEARAPTGPNPDGLAEAQLGALELIAGFAKHAKSHDHLDEFEALVECAREAEQMLAAFEGRPSAAPAADGNAAVDMADPHSVDPYAEDDIRRRQAEATAAGWV